MTDLDKKQIEKLLEEAGSFIRDGHCKLNLSAVWSARAYYEAAERTINQALALLRQPTCETCIVSDDDSIQETLSAYRAENIQLLKKIQELQQTIERQKEQIEYWQQAFKDRGGEIVDKSPDKPTCKTCGGREEIQNPNYQPPRFLDEGETYNVPCDIPCPDCPKPENPDDKEILK